LKAGTISRAYASTRFSTAGSAILLSTENFSAACCTFGSVISRWIRAWRRVRWNGRMPMRSREPRSSITWFAGRVTDQRSAGRSTWS
jgi:hypothetical protein